MKKALLRKIISAAVISVFMLSGAAFAATDAALVGRWAYWDVGVGYSGGYGEAFVLTFHANGSAVVENTVGCTRTKEAATWEADGRFLQMYLTDKPELEGADMAYEYSVKGDTLVLRQTYEEETMTLTRGKQSGKP